MIGFEKVASIYAEALLGAGVDAGTAGDLEADLTQLVQTFQSDVTVWNFFKSPVIDSKQKMDLIEKTLKDKVPDPLYSFLGVLCKRRRFELLPSILTEMKAHLDKYLGRKTVKVLTATALTAESKAELTAALKAKFKIEIVLEVEEKPDLIGGLVIRVGDFKNDSSIKDSLARLQKGLLGKRILGEKYYA